jgi:transcriptional regulator with XRE-family HTH domain
MNPEVDPSITTIGQSNLKIREPFGAALKTLRSRLGVPQEELARRSGLQPSYICDIERGMRNPSLESIVTLAHALGISAAALFSYDEFPGPDAVNQITSPCQPGTAANQNL